MKRVRGDGGRFYSQEELAARAKIEANGGVLDDDSPHHISIEPSVRLFL